MNLRPLVRPLLALAAVAAAMAVAGCDTDGVTPSLRSMQPLSPQMIAELEKRHMSRESPILVRIFKEEAELEVWKEDDTGKMALLKTYPICRWSGKLGPKIKEGDRQAPEGFYTITPSLMNPNSNYYLAINMGFPNAYDRANNRTGAFLMIHGDCSSRGCYAMTDEQIAEIYALARESFFGGQASFQIQAFPFRMTPENMARHRNSPHMKFWRMLKEGYDHFEVTHKEPKVDVCERRYVFNAESKYRFNPTGRCPSMQVPPDILAAVKDKEHRDELKTAELIRRGVPGPSVRTYTDGGMNPTFLAALKPYDVDSEGVVRTRISSPVGTIPANIRLPPEDWPTARTGSVREPKIAAQEAPRSHDVATESKSGGGRSSLFGNLFSSQGSAGSSQGGGMISRISALMGLGGPQPAARAPASVPKAKPGRSRRPAPTARHDKASKKTAKTRTGAIRPEPKPAAAPPAQAAAPTQEASAAPQRPSPAVNAGLLKGAQPTLPAGSFESRFGAWN